MATYPTFRHSPEFQGFSVEHPAQTLRTPMENGPAKQRRLFDAKTQIYKIRQILRSGERDTFLTFYFTEISNGNDWFTWTNPISMATERARIVSGQLDQDAPLNARLEDWVISFNVEVYG